MVTRYIKAYLGLSCLVMCGNTFNMTEIEVTEGYDNFSIMATCPVMFAEFEKLPGNPNFSQTSQAFQLASLEFIK